MFFRKSSNFSKIFGNFRVPICTGSPTISPIFKHIVSAWFLQLRSQYWSVIINCSHSLNWDSFHGFWQVCNDMCLLSQYRTQWWLPLSYCVFICYFKNNSATTLGVQITAMLCWIFSRVFTSLHPAQQPCWRPLQNVSLGVSSESGLCLISKNNQQVIRGEKEREFSVAVSCFSPIKLCFWS